MQDKKFGRVPGFIDPFVMLILRLDLKRVRIKVQKDKVLRPNAWQFASNRSQFESSYPRVDRVFE